MITLGLLKCLNIAVSMSISFGLTLEFDRDVEKLVQLTFTFIVRFSIQKVREFRMRKDARIFD